jgi:hypothetical protein
MPGLLPLHEWHIWPLTEEQAYAWLKQAQQGQRAAVLSGDSGMTWRVREMVARFWLGRSVYLPYLAMCAAAGNRYERALAELVYGQVLVSRRLHGAFEHLDAGLNYAHHLLMTQNYFTLVHRHELLRYLPLGDEPCAPQDLNALLIEAAVIKRLMDGPRARKHYAGHPSDTLG